MQSGKNITVEAVVPLGFVPILQEDGKIATLLAIEHPLRFLSDGSLRIVLGQ
jgi:hypothetical protein